MILEFGIKEKDKKENEKDEIYPKVVNWAKKNGYCFRGTRASL